MLIAAVSSSPVPNVRTSAIPTIVDTRERTPRRDEAQGARNNELVAAIQQMGGGDGEQGAAGPQAVLAFAHALMHDLQSVDAGASGPGNGRAWGRRNWSDLPQRIDALATAVQSSLGEQAAAPASAAAQAAVAPMPPEVAKPTNPVTTTSIAVHLMQVPSSRLVEAYAALLKAIGQEDAANATTPHTDLAAFLDQLAQRLAPDARPESPAASALHLTA